MTSLNDNIIPIDGLKKYPRLVLAYTTRTLGNLSFRTSPRGAGKSREHLAKELGISPGSMFSIPLGHTNRIAVFEDRSRLEQLDDRGYLPVEGLPVDEFPLVTDRLPDPDNRERYADGMIWREPDIYSLVITADCAAVGFYDPMTGACGNSHVGLLGAVNRLPEAMVASMVRHFGCRPSDVEVVIFPCIRKCHYDVSKSRTWQTIKRDTFDAYGEGNELYADGYFDLPGFIMWQLIASGIREDHVHDTGLCTVCRYGTFFSHVGAWLPGAQAKEGRFGAILGVRK